MSLMTGAVRDFHNVISKYTDFVIMDVSQKYNIDYKELSDRYIAKCSRSIRGTKTNVSNQLATASFNLSKISAIAK